MWVVGGGQQADAGRRLLQHVGQPEDLSTIVMIESVDGGAVRGYTRSTAVLRTLRLLLAPWWLAYWFGVMFPRALRDLVYMQVRVSSRVLRKKIYHTEVGWCQSMRPWLRAYGYKRTSPDENAFSGALST